MVGPAGGAHPHPRHPGAFGQSQGQPHRAGAAGGLHPIDAPIHRRIRGAKHIGHQRMNKAHIALWPEIGLGDLRLNQSLFRRLDRAEHRGIALAGAIDPDAKVNLIGPWIIVVKLDQREQRISGLLFEIS